MHNNGFPPKKVVERLKVLYPCGTRVELLYMSDPYTKITEGIQGGEIY